MLKNFFFNPGVFDYGFSETHPLKPERLHRTLELLRFYAGDASIDAPAATPSELKRVHREDYIEGVQFLSDQIGNLPSQEIDRVRTKYGFWGDNPAFPGMYEAASAYTGASIAAAKAVLDGEFLAFGIGGGLHHALAAKASGFCIFNDCAIACAVLREKFSRVAYVDIDVHHGDGVQWLFYQDPSILTCSIHEDGRTLWPGTGSTDESGADFTSLNVPLAAGTTASVWIEAFRETILSGLRLWGPEAIVLQMGSDSHYLDPLAHIQSNQQAWLQAILEVQELGVPIVALGGGGYNLTTVPRMWVSAVLTLAGIPFSDEIPEDLKTRLEVTHFSDVHYPFRGKYDGLEQARRVIKEVRATHLERYKTETRSPRPPTP